MLGGDDAWDGVDKTPVKCTKQDCGNGEAYYILMQIRR